MARGGTKTAADVGTPQQSMQPTQSSPNAGAEHERPRIYVFAGGGRRGVDSLVSSQSRLPRLQQTEAVLERRRRRYRTRTGRYALEFEVEYMGSRPAGKQRNYGLISETMNRCGLKVECVREPITMPSMRVHPRYVTTQMTALSNRFPSEIQMRKRPQEGNAAAGNKSARQDKSGTIRHKGVESKQGEITEAIPPCSSVRRTAVRHRGGDQECSSRDGQAIGDSEDEQAGNLSGDDQDSKDSSATDSEDDAMTNGDRRLGCQPG
ncbi:unnamed protein product [Phytophthora fragariaefolia]|uniref:Unnamed protein product n=1 Tax=Phytophthora fragariaefolia TaxID=1490495 RepID=A0A9W6X382_9STRA|nr:unnamed protein product [Phytophthora fragariaefolia]